MSQYIQYPHYKIALQKLNLEIQASIPGGFQGVGIRSRDWETGRPSRPYILVRFDDDFIVSEYVLTKLHDILVAHDPGRDDEEILPPHNPDRDDDDILPPRNPGRRDDDILPGRKPGRVTEGILGE